MKRKFSIILLSLILIISMSACSRLPGKDTPDIVPNDGENGAQDNIKAEKSLTLYYSDADAMNLVKKDVMVDIQDETIEEAIIDKLKEETDDERIYPVIPMDITIINVRTEEGTAYVDISSENLYGGSSQEQFIIAGIVMSLTELENIGKVQFLVDGNKVETLMGHISIDEPFTRDNIGIPVVEY